MKLELGAGGTPTAGFEHADVRPGNHIEHVFDMMRGEFPFPPNSVSHLLMHQTLEHFSRENARIILAKCRRVIRVGGMIQISVPNVEGWMEAYHRREIRWDDLMERIYGGQDYEFNFHKWGYSEKSLRGLLMEFEFKHLDFGGSCWTDLHVRGTKIC